MGMILLVSKIKTFEFLIWHSNTVGCKNGLWTDDLISWVYFDMIILPFTWWDSLAISVLEKVEKKTEGDKSLTKLNYLNPKQRIDEIAMMLSGNKITDTAIAHAKQLMN